MSPVLSVSKTVGNFSARILPCKEKTIIFFSQRKTFQIRGVEAVGKDQTITKISAYPEC